MTACVAIDSELQVVAEWTADAPPPGFVRPLVEPISLGPGTREGPEPAFFRVEHFVRVAVVRDDGDGGGDVAVYVPSALPPPWRLRLVDRWVATGLSAWLGRRMRSRT